MTKYQLHVQRWRNGCGSCQCGGAQQVVFARGSVPADVLFVGEAPGESEDALGRPFMGPAGKLLDQIVARSVGVNDPSLTWCMTNVVGCVPRDDVTGTDKAVEPDLDQIKACAPRLAEFVKIVRPRLVVCVGKIADKHFKTPDGIPVPTVVSITHPAAILRAHLAQQGLMTQRCVVAITEALEELCQP